MLRALGWLYFQLYRLIYPAVYCVAWLARPLHPKLAVGFRLRQEFYAGKSPSFASKPVWFHCASGEFEYIKPVIARLKEKHPQKKVLVTYFSPSSHRSILNSPHVDLAVPMPADLPGTWKKFLRHFDPHCLLIARTDLWPEMLYQAHRADIPSLLFSATLVTGSGRMKSWLRPLYRFVLENLETVYCVSEGDRQNFLQLGHPSVQVQGDSRFDQVLVRLQTPKPLKAELFAGIPRERIFIAGSTWGEDEKQLIPGFAQAKQSGSQWKMIIAPHEPTESHLKDLQALLKEHGLHYALYSQAVNWPEDVLVIDRVGILAELYLQAGLAFVGGSFRKTVHSVMEPLAAGCRTLVGPLHLNNREALHFARQPRETPNKAVVTVHDADEIERSLIEWQNFGEKATWREKLLSEIEKQTGASGEVLRWLENRLEPLS